MVNLKFCFLFKTLIAIFFFLNVFSWLVSLYLSEEPWGHVGKLCRSEHAAANAPPLVVSSAITFFFSSSRSSFLLLLLRFVSCTLFLTPSFLSLLFFPISLPYPLLVHPFLPLFLHSHNLLQPFFHDSYSVPFFVSQLRSDRYRKRNETDLWYDLPWGGKWFP